MRVLENPTLVLNKSWSAVGIDPLRKALKKTFKDRAKLLDEETFAVYSWEEWVDMFGIYATEDEITADGRWKYIETTKRDNEKRAFYVRAPEIIVLTKFNKLPRQDIKLNRRNLLIRDGFRCQYTGKLLNLKNMTFDHVVPISRGGKTTWDNLVSCSLEANMKKANRTLEECGYKLKKKPEKPKWHPLYTYFTPNRPKSWEKFINTDQWNEVGYWDVELKD